MKINKNGKYTIRTSICIYRIIIQSESTAKQIPSAALLRKWTKATLLDNQYQSAMLTIRVVDEAEMGALNLAYRHKPGPTNVLSFPFEPHEANSTKIPILGDIVICAPIVASEADLQHKSLKAHWAHMIVHGVLHLLGYDHISDKEAAVMEALEIKTLDLLEFPNPYKR
ncbi:MAG TPA: rRNA maturation RNase YbeY [Gammaproteobacteria bacterium]|jgi:probable rRNA maturation factor|nr:rRNA maturation RNase YbeY [Gammaproteobacteria bacterium]